MRINPMMKKIHQMTWALMLAAGWLFAGPVQAADEVSINISPNLGIDQPHWHLGDSGRNPAVGPEKAVLFVKKVNGFNQVFMSDISGPIPVEVQLTDSEYDKSGPVWGPQLAMLRLPNNYIVSIVRLSAQLSQAVRANQDLRVVLNQFYNNGNGNNVSTFLNTWVIVYAVSLDNQQHQSVIALKPLGDDLHAVQVQNFVAQHREEALLLDSPAHISPEDNLPFIDKDPQVSFLRGENDPLNDLQMAFGRGPVTSAPQDTEFFRIVFTRTSDPLSNAHDMNYQRKIYPEFMGLDSMTRILALVNNNNNNIFANYKTFLLKSNLTYQYSGNCNEDVLGNAAHPQWFPDGRNVAFELTTEKGGQLSHKQIATVNITENPAIACVNGLNGLSTLVVQTTDNEDHEFPQVSPTALFPVALPEYGILFQRHSGKEPYSLASLTTALPSLPVAGAYLPQIKLGAETPINFEDATVDRLHPVWARPPFGAPVAVIPDWVNFVKPWWIAYERRDIELADYQIYGAHVNFLRAPAPGNQLAQAQGIRWKDSGQIVLNGLLPQAYAGVLTSASPVDQLKLQLVDGNTGTFNLSNGTSSSTFTATTSSVITQSIKANLTPIDVVSRAVDSLTANSNQGFVTVDTPVSIGNLSGGTSGVITVAETPDSHATLSVPSGFSGNVNLIDIVGVDKKIVQIVADGFGVGDLGDGFVLHRNDYDEIPFTKCDGKHILPEFTNHPNLNRDGMEPLDLVYLLFEPGPAQIGHVMHLFDLPTPAAQSCAVVKEPPCGNGQLDPGEDCDDDNVAGNDGCSATCHSEVSCGNGISGEAITRDGVAGGVEECDDGNLNNDDGCSDKCIKECGDKVVGQNEQCDDGDVADPVNGDLCNQDCTLVDACGDGILEAGEDCDVEGQWCHKCQLIPGCGNGQVEVARGEECEDGNNANGDGCNAKCQTEPPPPACGNGVKEGIEKCDDNNLIDGDGCSHKCVTEFCGDKIPQPNLGEECDEGPAGGPKCLRDCHLKPQVIVKPHCGNRDPQPGLGEQCDDGNNDNGDGCDAKCRSEIFCGNGKVDGDDQCDDGNQVETDGCTSNCKKVPDNCPNVNNPDQVDRDGDGVGDVCDLCPDDVAFSNKFPVDTNGDGKGDACMVPVCERDCQVLPPPPCDVPPGSPNDSDGDGKADFCDNCPETANSDQANRDPEVNAIGDACDFVPDPNVCLAMGGQAQPVSLDMHCVLRDDCPRVDKNGDPYILTQNSQDPENPQWGSFTVTYKCSKAKALIKTVGGGWGCSLNQTASTQLDFWIWISLSVGLVVVLKSSKKGMSK